MSTASGLEWKVFAAIVAVGMLSSVGCSSKSSGGAEEGMVCLSVVPSSGPSTGGTDVTITGAGYRAGAVVRFGGADATAVAVSGDGKEIACRTPPGTQGVVDLLVRNPDTKECMIVDGFRYVVPLQSALYVDTNANGIVDAWDTVTVSFAGDVVLQGTPPVQSVFEPDPPGAVMPGATVLPGAGPNEVRIILQDGALIQPNGDYGTSPGSSGLNVAPGQTALIDPLGPPLQPMPVAADIEGELNPRITGLSHADVNTNCLVDAGDTLEVTFTAAVTFTTPAPDLAFQLPVSGDSLGAGASFLGGGAPGNVRTATIVLGSAPVLRPGGTFDLGTLVPGSPSGLDVAAAPGAVVDAAVPGVAALPYAPAGLDMPDSGAGWTSLGDDLRVARFGTSVASAGDVNGDGFDDVIIGAADYKAFGSQAGKAYLYLGSPAGLSPTPAWTSVGDDQIGAEFGGSVASAGDVNGDGYDDVIIGAAMFNSISNYDTGKAYLFLGGASGLAATPGWVSHGDDVTELFFGWSVAPAGDVDGDGYDDVIIGGIQGVPFRLASGPGRAYLYRGSLGGLGTTAAWTSVGDDQFGARYGFSVATAGDVDGDGYSDVIVGAIWQHTTPPPDGYQGKAYVYLGSPAGLASTPAWTSSGDNVPSKSFGESVSSAGDVNNDGYSDVIVGVPRQEKAFLYLGEPSGLETVPAWTSRGDNQGGSYFGFSVAPAGDPNADGFDDIIIGAPKFDVDRGPGARAGKAYIFLWGPGGPPSWPPGWTSTGDAQGEALFGNSVASAGDVNGDGFPDPIVGAWDFSTAESFVGKAYLFCVRP